MKQSEIEKCVICGKGVMHSGNICFYRIKIERMGVKVKAVQRQHGLELMLGSAVLASIMGPDEDLAVSITGPDKAIVCDECAIEKSMPLAMLHEYMCRYNGGLRDDEPGPVERNKEEGKAKGRGQALRDMDHAPGVQGAKGQHDSDRGPE